MKIWKKNKANKNILTNVSYMFSSCKTLESIEYSIWDANNIVIMSNMFSSCYSLTLLTNISAWNTNKTKDIINILSGFH